jgi:hypothetical protein
MRVAFEAIGDALGTIRTTLDAAILGFAIFLVGTDYARTGEGHRTRAHTRQHFTTIHG